MIDRLKNILGRESVASKPAGSGGSQARTPVPFVVGVGRSGTTLLRLMLDAHPELAIPPETHFIPKAAKAVRGAEDPRAEFVRYLTEYRTWGDHQIPARDLEEAVSRIEPFDFSEAVRAFYELYAARFDKPRWGDKTPRYVLKMRQLQAILPEARFVHLIRDGRDVAMSNSNVWFGPESVRESARWWSEWISLAREQSKQIDHYLEVRYENLVRNPEPVLREICSFLDLRWDDAMLNYHEKAAGRLDEITRDVKMVGGNGTLAGESRANIHALTKKPPDRSRIGRWREKMDPDDLRTFEEVAADTLKSLGYSTYDESSILLNNRRFTKLGPKAEKLSESIFVGSPPRFFESVGRLQLITLLREGLYPDSRVLDVGCGCLRGGYWLIHFLNSGGYRGIEPNEEMLRAGIEEILEPGVVEEKAPSFDHNADFDFSVFGEKFDFVVARSIWTHASKTQIETMLDSFVANSSPNALFLTSYIPASEAKPDYKGEAWLGRSHASETPGTVSHSLEWIEAVCKSRDLAVVEILNPEYVANGQVWLKIRRPDLP